MEQINWDFFVVPVNVTMCNALCLLHGHLYLKLLPNVLHNTKINKLKDQ